MADSRAVEGASAGVEMGPRSRRALRLRAQAPTWLRALSILAFARAGATAGVAWFWLAHRDEALGQTWIVAWAVSTILFELIAGVTLLITARGGVPAGVALTLAILAFAHLALGVVLFVGAGGFGRASGWALAWGLFDNLVRVPLIMGVLWPAILARAKAIEASIGPQGS